MLPARISPEFEEELDEDYIYIYIYDREENILDINWLRSHMLCWYIVSSKQSNIKMNETISSTHIVDLRLFQVSIWLLFRSH